MNYLLDTNVISETTKLEPAASVIDWLTTTPISEIGVSVLTLGELQRGILADPSEKRRAALQSWYEGEFLTLFRPQILNVTAEVMTVWASRYQVARAKGKTPSTMDSLLAATAAAHGLTVVTRNDADFLPMEVKTLNLWT